jgi:hypothetical protein
MAAETGRLLEEGAYQGHHEQDMVEGNHVCKSAGCRVWRLVSPLSRNRQGLTPLELPLRYDCHKKLSR